MKRYLIRAAFNPIKNETVNPNACLWHTYVGGNTGNLMFAYGVMNALTTENTTFDTTQKFKFSDAEISEINEKYDAFILPMADAFRPDFLYSLKNLTAAIKKMTIPVIVVGVGVRADYEPDFKKGLPYDNDVKEFVKAVLAKSSMIGLRGCITGDYLQHLGFVPDKDFTAIGCPSLYMYGDSIKTKEITKQINRLAINTNGYYPFDNIHQFLTNSIKKAPEVCLVQQIDLEFRDMYIGKWWIPTLVGIRPNPQDHMIIKGENLKELYKNDQVRVFFDVPSWINEMKTFDFFVGNRFHGSVAAILAGLPHVFVPFNARTREMIEYHHLTSIKPEEVNGKLSVFDILDGKDFKTFEKNQNKNLSHYIEFLNLNGLEHVFSKKMDYKQGESPMEIQIQKQAGKSFEEILHTVNPFLSLSLVGKLKRIASSNISGLYYLSKH